jgi:hypothetical protein
MDPTFCPSSPDPTMIVKSVDGMPMMCCATLVVPLTKGDYTGF